MRRSLLAFALLAVSAGYLPAQEPSRELNGYEFIPSRIVADPFAVTYFGTSTGGGLAFALETPFVDVDGDTLGTLTGDVAFLALGFEYQQRIGQWLGVRFAFTGNGRIGTDEQSMLAQGVTGTFGWELALRRGSTRAKRWSYRVHWVSRARTSWASTPSASHRASSTTAG